MNQSLKGSDWVGGSKGVERISEWMLKAYKSGLKLTPLCEFGSPQRFLSRSDRHREYRKKN